MPTIKFVNEKKEIQVPAGANLRQEARRAGVQLYAFPENYLNCRGFGLCAGCRVNIAKGMENLSPMGTWEKLNLGKTMVYIGNEKTMRLACQAEVMGDVEVLTTPPMNLFGENFFS
jgi:ferredoxin